MEPTAEVKKALIQKEIEAWQNTLYQAKLRHRVHEQIGAAPEVLESLKKDIARALQAIDACNSILAEVETESAVEHVNGKEPSHANVAK